MASKPEALARYLGLFKSPETLANDLCGKSDEDHIRDLHRMRHLMRAATVDQISGALQADMGSCLRFLLRGALGKNKGELLEVTVQTLCDIVDKIKSRPTCLACLVDMVPDVLERVNQLDTLSAKRALTLVNLIFEVIPADFDMMKLPSVDSRTANLPARSLLHILCRSEASPDVMQRFEHLVKENLKTGDGLLACAVLNNWIKGSASETIFRLMSKFLECLIKALESRERVDQNLQHHNLQFKESQRLQSAVLQIIEKFTFHDARVVLQNLTDKNLQILARICECSEGFKHTQIISTEMLRMCVEQEILRLKDSGLVRSLLMSHHDVTQLDQEAVAKVMANCLNPGLAEWLVACVVVPDIQRLVQVNHPCLLRAYLQCLSSAIATMRNGELIAKVGNLLKYTLEDLRMVGVPCVEEVNLLMEMVSKPRMTHKK